VRRQIYNANITGTDDQINGFESFTVAKDPKVSLVILAVY
jgi:hypothetical protein